MEREAAIRLLSFLTVFATVTLCEYLWPRRPLKTDKARRWFTNISIAILDTLVARLMLPVMPAVAATMAADRGWGLLSVLGTPLWLSALFSFLALDLLIYLQHRIFHRTPLFWRFHRMHHTDLDIDVSSGNRFHPVEILVSLLIKVAAVVLLGAPVVAVLLFEVILNATSLFNHGNIKIPSGVDAWLRLVLVTPDMHRVHHSAIPRETDSNFSFNFPWWDRLFGTYRDQPRDGHLDMVIGLKEFRDPNRLGLAYLLMLPFRGRNG